MYETTEMMREEQKISIIIPIYNTQDYLTRCFQSILDQDYPFFEVILLDDGSQDRSGEICDQWSKKDNRFRTIHTENKGQSSARNLGIEESTGEYITFIDSDDYVSSDYLSYLLSLFVRGCKITECNHYISRKNKTKPNSKANDRIFTKEAAFEDVLFGGCIDVAPWGKLYKREVFATLRFPEGRIFEDTWLFGDLLNQSETISFGSKCCYYYTIREQSTVRRSFSLSNLQYIEASQKLASDAIKISQGMEIGAARKINHARLSVLRYMNHCENQYKKIRSSLREQILKQSRLYINDPRTPKRDRVAVKLLRMGLFPFYFGWGIYSMLR